MIQTYRTKPSWSAMRIALLAATATATALAGAAPVAARAQAAVQRQYDLPAGSLASVLNRFAAQNSLALSYPPALSAGRTTQGLSGWVGIDDGFQRLLQGSGLRAVRTGDRAYTLEPVRPASNAPSQSSALEVPTTQIDDVVVIGDWLGDASAANVLRHPGARDVIRRGQFAETGGVALRDALRRIPGVNAPAPNGTGNNDLALNFGVRGLNPRLASRSTVLMDGIPTPFAPYGQPQLTVSGVSLGNLQAVDVVRGGGSVRYGPQNVGGIVNFVTRAVPRDFALSAAGQVSGAADGAGGLRYSGNLFVGGTNDQGLGAALMYSTVRGETYRDHSDTRVDDVILKLRYEIDARNTVSGIAQYYDGRADMPGGLSTANYAADPYRSTRPIDSFWGDRTLLGLTWDFRPSDLTHLTTTAFHTRTLRSGYLDQGTNVTLSPRRYKVSGIETRLSQGFRTGALTHEVGVGYRYIHETGAEKRYLALASTGVLPTESSRFDRDTQGRTEAHAVYIDDRIDFGRWSVTPGLRYEFIDIQQTNALNGAVFQGSYSVPLPALSVSYRASNDLTLYANTMRSFGSVQYSRIQVAEATSYGPEEAQTWEVGGRWNNGVLRLEGAAFLINFDNQYESNQQTNSVTARGETRHQGIEIASRYRFDAIAPGLEAYANYTFLDATIREAGANQGNRIPFSSKHSGVFGVDYRRDAWTFNVDGAWQSDQFADNANTVVETASGNAGVIPGSTVFGARAAYRFGPELSNVGLAVGVRNLFDKAYFTRSFDDNNLGKYIEEPRTIYVQFSVDL